MAKKRYLSITEIENSIQYLINHLEEKEFITEFLSFFDIPKISITRAKVKFDKGEPFIIKNKVYYSEIQGDVIAKIDTMEQEIEKQKSKPRYLIANNYTDIAALDFQTRDTINIPLKELPLKADFFLAWNGIEKSDYQLEHPADRKAAERFAKLYDVLEKDNPNVKEHAFNVFLIRILFLLFAEDTGIMKKSLFTNTLKLRTNEDGSNFNEVIKDLFEILNIDELKRYEKKNWLKSFPYVNGKLFAEPHIPLVFTKKSRKLLIEAGELLDWNEINPDILGSMIQTVASSKERQVTGMHYTSVPNIMKVIKPLFLDELYKIYNNLSFQYEKNKNKNIKEKTVKNYNKKIVDSLSKLLEKISRIKFLDPACGSGNFLIITYKEIRRLEIKILLLIDKIQKSETIPMTSIYLDNFNGIEVDDFAHEVAKLSLWIAEHQMNEEMSKALPGYISALLPLKDSGNIILGNALRVNWNDIIPQNEDEDIYIFGNPPYIGSANRNDSQKKDLAFVFQDTSISFGKLDYILGWFYKAVKFMEKRKSAFAFVSTNSIVQGEQVSLIWPELFKTTQISFAYPSFKWNNSAKSNAGVTVVIIGFEYKGTQGKKSIYSSNGTVKKVDNINSYLVEGENVIVYKETKPLNNLPEMPKGSSPTDDGGLIFSEYEYQNTVEMYPELKKILKKYRGSKEYIEDINRYVLWMSNNEVKLFEKNPVIKKRLEHVRLFRLEKKIIL